MINDFSYMFLKNDRVGFIGPNGSGKTTQMKIILGEVAADSGFVELGQTVRIGYYAQEIGGEEMDPKMRVIDYIRNVAEFVDTDEGKVSAARMLERFLFAGEDQYGLLGKLSGGERRRLYLLKMLMGAPNVLILDEPTNDLDIATLRILEDYLDRFQGIVIVVSHDRYFLDRTVRRIFAMEEGRFVQYEGGYTDYANRRKEQQDTQGIEKDTQGSGNRISEGRKSTPGGKNHFPGERENAPGIKENAGKKDWKMGQKRKLRFTYQEQKDYETIEGDMAALEEEIRRLDQDMLKYSSDFVKLGELSKQKEAAEKALEDKMERWMYLEDLAARIENGETVGE